MKNFRFNPKFLVKPFRKGRPYPCFGKNFDITTDQCRRVNNMEAYRNGLSDISAEEAGDLNHIQPVFYLMEQADGFKGYQEDERLVHKWNGLLLFSHSHKDRTRKTVMENRKPWNVVLAFDDPDKDRYWFVVDTREKWPDEETFWCDRATWKELLDEKLVNTMAYDSDYYVRALTPDHYDIVDREVLFGE